jgi:hypothetical protein
VWTDEATANPLTSISIYVDEPGNAYSAYGYTGADGIYTTTRDYRLAHIVCIS